MHALKHAVRFGARIEGAYAADVGRLRRLANDLAPDLAPRLAGLIEPVSPETFAKLAPMAPETGVIALAERPQTDPAALLAARSCAPVVWLEEPAHLGNVGAAVRVAAAAGAGAVITTGGPDPWHPAALRGSAGLHFALPVLRLPEVPEIDRPLLAIDPDGDPVDPAALPANAVFAFGSERRGLSPALLNRADRRLAIPMRERVSSLNLATAVAVVLYAWRFADHRR